MSIESPYYPIIYVRGYAATMNEIEETVATPYMGFNLGSTKIRQDYENEIVQFIFESPLIRLMKEEGYTDVYKNGGLIPTNERVPAKSVWIFRYYEPVSEDLGEGERRTIPRFAVELRKFILRIRDQICADDVDMRSKFKVYLVAHSMGGLICRCYLQNICRHGFNDAYAPGELPGSEELDNLELKSLPADTLVDKVFTYATPHNGIEVAGHNVPDIGSLDKLHARNFNRKYMREYLRLPDGSNRVDSLDNAFPVERFFCFVGSNYSDYSAFLGLSKKGTGPMSDGLVMMSNASVKGAPRAFAHRCHSGHYGIVNSEEGYQNLRRFFYGDVRVDFKLIIDEITLPENIEEEVGDQRERVRAAYNIEVAASIRGLNVFLNERKVSQESAIRRTYEALTHDQKPVYLFSGYLLKRGKMSSSTRKSSSDTALAFAVDLGVQVPVYEVDRRFWLDDHFEGGYVFKDSVTFHVRTTAKGTTLRYGLVSRSGPGVAKTMLESESQPDGGLSYELPVGFKQGIKHPPKPGLRGRLQMTAKPWNE